MYLTSVLEREYQPSSSLSRSPSPSTLSSRARTTSRLSVEAVKMSVEADRMSVEDVRMSVEAARTRLSVEAARMSLEARAVSSRRARRSGSLGSKFMSFSHGQGCDNLLSWSLIGCLLLRSQSGASLFVDTQLLTMTPTYKFPSLSE